MRSFHSRCLFCVLACVFVLSFTFQLGPVEAFPGKGALKDRNSEKALLLAERIRKVNEIKKKHTESLLDIFGVVGTGVGLDPDGEPVIRVFTSWPGIREIPASLDSVPVRAKVTGMFYALAEVPPEPNPTTKWPRPVPIGVSTGHPDITAGTIGCRVTDPANQKVFALSNNHVYANINKGLKGVDPVLQPGTVDGGTLGDAIGILEDFEPIKFCYYWWFWLICRETNTIDAAIALSSTEDLDAATPPDGYGTPNPVIHPAYGDPDIIGDENLAQLLGIGVQKYGRTTALTVGTVDAINATVNVCYDDFCEKVARFVDQIIITPGSFSGGGDSGSLIVTQEGNHPVGLLFAGSDTNTIANRIDLVLNRFDVTVDSGEEEPVTLDSISVEPVTATIEVDQRQQFTATGYYSDGSTADITSIAEWASSDTSVASIDASGFATGVSEGTTEITAAQGDITSNIATLQVTTEVQPPVLESILIEPPIATIEENQTQQFTATGNYSDGSTADLTLAATWSSSNTAVATIDDTGLATGHGEGSAEIAASEAGITSGPASLTVTSAQPLAGPQLETGRVWASTERWETVPLEQDYGADMVVVCTPNYDEEDPSGFFKNPLVVRVQTYGPIGYQFEVRLVPAVAASIEPREAWVHWMVVKRGVYTVAEHGVKMEAAKFTSSVTDRSGSWVAQPREYQQSYEQPVVLGQVMTSNGALWSTFWCRSESSATKPPNGTIRVGKHSGQDSRARTNEIVGYIVIEAGSGSMEGTNYVADLGPDKVQGVQNNPPYTYTFSDVSFIPSTAIAIQAAMDGGDGGWAILYGDNPVTHTTLNLAIEEDWYWDSERKHTNEQVGYIVFGY